MYSVSLAGAGSGMLAAQIFPAIGIESSIPSAVVGLAVVLLGYAWLHRRVAIQQHS